MSVEHPLCAMHCSKHLGFTGEQKGPRKEYSSPYKSYILFNAAYFIMAKSRKKLKYPLIRDWLGK